MSSPCPQPRDRLTPNAKLPDSLVYTPIEDWSNDDVWLFLMQVKNPWGYHLDYDETEKVTVPREGYFWNAQASSRNKRKHS